jgi:hypothetical protein
MKLLIRNETRALYVTLNATSLSGVFTRAETAYRMNQWLTPHSDFPLRRAITPANRLR